MTGAFHHQRGSALPEMAIIIAVMLMFVFGIIDFGRYMYTYAFVANTARQTARWAIVRGSASCTNTPNLDHACDGGNGTSTGATPADIQTYARGLNIGLTPNQLTVNQSTAVVWPGCTTAAGVNPPANGPGCQVAVQVSYPFTFILGFLPRLQYTMTSTSTMVISQ